MDKKCCSCNPKAMAAALLRWTIGLIFLVGGVSKLGMLNGFVHGYLVPAFEKTVLPAALVVAYGYALPFVELAIGVLLLLGLCRVFALSLAGLTLLSLCFGQMLLKAPSVIADISLYVLMTATALFMIENDCCALDNLRGADPIEE